MYVVKKEPYVQPALVKHEVLRDITAGASGGYTGQTAQGNQNQNNQ